MHAQFVENWVAYHYFDVTNHRWEMSVLELYNKAQGNVTISDMVFGKTSSSMSSYEPVPVEVTHTRWTSRGLPHTHVADLVCMKEVMLFFMLLLLLCPTTT